MIQQAHIIGTGSSMPERILSNKDLETIVDTTDEWIVRRSGIKERRISSNEKKESTTDLATQASLKALEMAEISPVEWMSSIISRMIQLLNSQKLWNNII